MFRLLLPLNSLLTRSTQALQFSVLKNAGFPNFFFFLRNKTWLCKNYNVYCDSKLLRERTNTNPELSVLWLHSFTHEPLIFLQQWEDSCSVRSLLNLVFYTFLFSFVCFTMYMCVYIQSCFSFNSFWMRLNSLFNGNILKTLSQHSGDRH